MHIISILGKWRKNGEFKAGFGFIASFWNSQGCVRPCFNPLHSVHPQKNQTVMYSLDLICKVAHFLFLCPWKYSFTIFWFNNFPLEGGESLNFSNQWRLKNHIQVGATKWCAEPAQIGQCLEDWTWTYIYIYTKSWKRAFLYYLRTASEHR